MMKTQPVFLAVALVGTPQMATAKTPRRPPSAEAKAQVTRYVMAVGRGDLYEIETSRLAMQTSRTLAVPEVADMLVKHHQKATAATMTAARETGINLAPPVLDPRAATSIAELRTAGDEEFDRVYLPQHVPAHRAAPGLHQCYGERGNQAALWASAKAAVPIVRSHLTAAERLQASPRRGM